MERSHMKILDLDMDYFMEEIVHTSDSVIERLSEEDYSSCVWTETRVRSFLENNLGLTKEKRIKGRIVVGHNESLHFWKELIDRGELTIPFEVVHVDSHADLGLGYASLDHILKVLLSYPVEERSMYNRYVDFNGRRREEGVGDYLLFAIAYQWISKITYCANPNGDKNDYIWETLKDFQENFIWDKPVENRMQLLYNPNMDLPRFKDSPEIKEKYVINSIREPEVPLIIIPTLEDVKYNGDFEFAIMAQSPNYTPASADFIMDIFREYIVEC
jgi:hypothetical protein